MINVFILCLVGAFSLGMFSVGFQFSSVNHVFVSTPKEVFEKAVSLNPNDLHLLNFDKDLLDESLETYYSKNISQYVKEFRFHTYFLDENDEFCSLEYCPKVKVFFFATIAFDLVYSKTITYEIERTDNG